MIDARVVFLTHYIPLYQVRVLQSIAASVRDFHVLVSTPIEPNRDFAPDWSGLNVTVQNTWTLRRQWHHRGEDGFSDSLYVHIPYDTGKKLRSLAPDVVMSLELGARSVGAARFCRRHPRSKLILCTYMSQRTEQFRGRTRHWLRKRLVKSADGITYNGPSCQNYLRSLGVDENRLFHLPYAADDRTLYRGPLQRDESNVRRRLIVVGQLSNRKGIVPLIDHVADYLRRHPDRRAELWFAGDGPERDRATSRPIPPNMTLEMLGNVPAGRLGQLMSTCGAMVAPTLADEWMLAVNEGLHAGLPVIGSVHSQAVTTLVRDGHNGWRYEPSDQTKLDRALDAYFSLSDVDLAAMRQRCRDSVAHCSPDWAASGGIDAIASVVGETAHSDSPPSQTSSDREPPDRPVDPGRTVSAVDSDCQPTSSTRNIVSHSTLSDGPHRHDSPSIQWTGRGMPSTRRFS